MDKEPDRILSETVEQTEEKALLFKTEEHIETRLGKQTLWMRYSALGMAVIVIGGLVCVERQVFNQLLLKDNLPETIVFLAIAPIAAITAIVVAFLVGAFRGYRGNEMNLSGLAGKFSGDSGSSP